MYDFSGLIHRIWGVCGIIFFMGVICILFEKPWAKGFKWKKCKLEIITIIFSVCLSLVYAFKIFYPDVSSYTGEFIDSHRNSRKSPATYEYVFWNGEGKKQVFYLDAFSKKKIVPSEFEIGQVYTIYFDEFTNVIVKVEIIE